MWKGAVTLVMRAHLFPSHLFWIIVILSWDRSHLRAHPAPFQTNHAVTFEVSAFFVIHHFQSSYALTDQPGSRGAATPTQLDMNPHTSAPSSSSVSSVLSRRHRIPRPVTPLPVVANPPRCVSDPTHHRGTPGSKSRFLQDAVSLIHRLPKFLTARAPSDGNPP
jgi:hypothetical protein